MNIALKLEPGKARPHAEPGYNVQVATTLEDVVGMADIWTSLQNCAADQHCYFQTFEWCRAWLSQFGDVPEQLYVIAVTCDETPVLLWPLMIEQSGLGLKTLTTLSEPHAQYSAVLVERGPHCLPAVESAWSHIISAAPVDAIAFPSIPAGSVLAERVLTEEDIAAAHDVSSIMDLTQFSDWDAHQAALSSSTRRYRNKRRNRLNKLGQLRSAVHEAGTPDFARVVGTLLDMKATWLRETGKASRALSMPGNADFLSSIPASADGACRPLVCELTLDGRMIAGEIGFDRDGHYIGYLGAFDWELRQHSPGKVQMSEMQRWCLETGIRHYDLLGEAGTYKATWSNTDVPLVDYHAGLSTRGRLHASLWLSTLRPAMKKQINRLPLPCRRAVLSALGKEFVQPD